MASAKKQASVLKRASSLEQDWPALPLGEWEPTYRTLHMWTQIVGKIRMSLAPPENHWWNVALYVNTRGLTTSPIPYQGRTFEIQFDFVHHRLELLTPDGEQRFLELSAKSVAAFYGELLSLLREAGIAVQINTKPQEVANPIPFEQDETHASYDAEYANRFWRILRSTDLVLHEFRSGFLGKQSPVHFFWGSFDICCTRFSGGDCPPRKGVITSEAYSRECASVGWWPGGGEVSGPAFYAYSAPEPSGYGAAPVRPGAAFYHGKLHEFLLMYEDVRRASSPAAEILEFAESTYEAGANLANWDRAALEKKSSF